MVTDGASVIKKTGKLPQITHQLCLSHGVHLAVVDVLYKKANDLVEGKDFCFQKNLIITCKKIFTF